MTMTGYASRSGRVPVPAGTFAHRVGQVVGDLGVRDARTAWIADSVVGLLCPSTANLALDGRPRRQTGMWTTRERAAARPG